MRIVSFGLFRRVCCASAGTGVPAAAAAAAAASIESSRNCRRVTPDIARFLLDGWTPAGNRLTSGCGCDSRNDLFEREPTGVLFEREELTAAPAVSTRPERP